jgi:hypothetical protein
VIDRILLALLGASILCGALVVAELRQGDTASAIAPRTPAGAKVPAANRPKFPPSGDLVAASLARPLFSATRRPAGRANDAPVDGLDAAKLRLTGVVIETDRHVAIFAVQGGKPITCFEGETVNQWHVDQILPRQVVLSGPAGSLTMEMRGDPSLVRAAITTPAAHGNAVQSQENVARGSPTPATRPAASLRTRTTAGPGSGPSPASDASRSHR